MSIHRHPGLLVIALAAGSLVIAACGATGIAPPTTGIAPPTPSTDVAAASPKVRQLIGPPNMCCSNAAIYGDLVWTSGHLPFHAGSGSDPFAKQVEAVLDNLEATLTEAGAGFDTILKTNVYLMSFDDWEAFNDVYVARIGQHGLPPRTTVQIAGLGMGRIEIEMVAHVREP